MTIDGVTLPEGWRVVYAHGTNVDPDTGTYRLTYTSRGRWIRNSDRELRRWTRAVIRDDANGVIAQGLAILHPGDQWNRRLGNRIALGRAVKSARRAGKIGRASSRTRSRAWRARTARRLRVLRARAWST